MDEYYPAVDWIAWYSLAPIPRNHPFQAGIIPNGSAGSVVSFVLAHILDTDFSCVITMLQMRSSLNHSVKLRQLLGEVFGCILKDSALSWTCDPLGAGH